MKEFKCRVLLVRSRKCESLLQHNAATFVDFIIKDIAVNVDGLFHVLQAGARCERRGRPTATSC